MSSLGQGKISGATRSATQHRVNSCKSRVSRGVESIETSARRSSMSMLGMLQFGHYKGVGIGSIGSSWYVE